MKYFVLICILLTFYGCSENDKTDNLTISPGRGVYVLNEGTWGNNNSSISYIDHQNSQSISNVPVSIWHHPLGDTGNSFFVSGDSVFVCVTSSNKIEYFSKSTGVWLGSFSFPQQSEPRFGLKASDGNIYVSSFSLGALIRINSKTMTQDSIISVGSFPDQLTESNKKIFSGITDLGSGHSVAVYNLESRKREKDIQVDINPAEIIGFADHILVHTTGSYLAPKSTLYHISSATLSVTDSVVSSKPITLLGKYSNQKYYAATSDGFFITDQSFNLTTPLIPTSSVHSPILFSAFYDAATNKLWIASTESYTVQGWLEGFVNGVRVSGPYQTGINPGDLITN